MSTTPSSINESVRELCAQIGSSVEPLFVPVCPEPNARQGYCFPNVETKTLGDGGEMVLGWAVWEQPGLLIEGEFHACWKSPSGNLVDITPKPDGEQQILFVPDSNREWDRGFVGNIRVPLCAGDFVATIIEWGERTDALRKQFWCGDHFDIPRHERLALDREFEGRLSGPAQRPGRNDPCWCGNGKKYKSCHRNSDERMLSSYLNSWP